MKKVLTLVAVAGMFAFVACGPSAEEKQAAEKRKQDSIAQADSIKAAEDAAAAQAKADSAKAAEEAAAAQAQADSAAAEEASKGGKK